MQILSYLQLYYDIKVNYSVYRNILQYRIVVLTTNSDTKN